MREADGREVLVVLIHGLGRSPASMRALARRLRGAGFAVERLRYPSTRLTVAAAVEHVRAALTRLAAERRLDLVGHSLGGVIAVRILRDPRGLRIGRVVQIGAPNLGSVIADRLSGFRIVRYVFGPAIAELRAHGGRAPRNPLVAAIAGTGGFWPGPLARPNDGTVAVRSAWSGAGHRAHVPALHARLPSSALTARMVSAYLRDGRFPERAA